MVTQTAQAQQAFASEGQALAETSGHELPLEPASGRGRKHGTSSSEPYDRWFRYPAGFASDYVAMLLDHIDLEPGKLIVDPFAGSAVTGTAARAAGLGFYGIEAHPLICELGKLKLKSAPEPPAALLSAAADLCRKAANAVEKYRSHLEREPDLVRRCFSEPVLAQLVSLRNTIKLGGPGVWQEYLKWALLATLRDVASVRVGWPYQRPANARQPPFADVLSRFQQRASWMAEDLKVTPAAISNKPTYLMQQGDSASEAPWRGFGRKRAQGCISSPPYLNNFDYADATRLELYFWGEVTSWSEMVRDVRSDMVIATTQQSSVGSAAAATRALNLLGFSATQPGGTLDLLKEERLSRPRGKEYDRVLPAYFAAMSRVLANLSKHLSSGSPIVWLVGDSAPYGVYVDTPALIGELALNFDLKLERDVVLRRRGERWAGNSKRHNMELSERLILLRRA